MARSQEGTEPTGRAAWPAAGPLVIAAVATVATLATLAPERWGPGVTCDEWPNVADGKGLVLALRQQGLGFFAPANIERNFPWKPGSPPFHPPLGYWILGWTHHPFDSSPDDPAVISVAGGRFAGAVTLGLLVLLVGLWTTRREGPLAGTVAAAAVVLVPRMFAHGHLAGLDMLTTLLFVAALVAVVEAEARGGRTGWFALAGLIWGLALLTRLHGLLVVPPVFVWLVWRRRLRAAVPLTVWGATGMATFFAGWPWLWLAPIAHLRQFLGTATARQPLHLFYVGQVWDDHQVPWHYPIVMFVVTLPLGLLLLGLLGLWAKASSRSDFRSSERDRRTFASRKSGHSPSNPLPRPKCRSWRADPGYVLVVGTAAFLLLVFAWPGVPVYDGTRLFLMVFPLWAVSVGVGAKWLAEHAAWQSVPSGFRLTAVGLFVGLQGVGLLLYHPCQLSHYSLLVGGLRGADRLGFEVTYWGDTVREPFLVEVGRHAPGETALYGPNLAPIQAEAVWRSSPALAEKAWFDKRTPLVGWDPSRPASAADCRWAVLYHRKADLAAVPEEIRSAEVIVEYRKQGVWLARLVRIPERSGRVGSFEAPAQAGAKQ